MRRWVLASSAAVTLLMGPGAFTAVALDLRETLTWNRLVLKYSGDTAVEVLESARNPAR